MEKVTIEMDWHDAAVMLSKLKTRQTQDSEIQNMYIRDGEPIPSWLAQNIETLSRIIDVVDKAITAK